MKFWFSSIFIIAGFLQTLAQSHPNFIVILADDQGWTGTSVLMDPDDPESKSDYYETPNLEILASQGTRFSQAYAPSPKCSPSRMSILTGQTTARNHFTNTSSRTATGMVMEEPSSNNTIPSSSTTIAEYLKAINGANYTSAYLGKWHLGNDGPESHGFDVSDGNTNNDEGDTGSSLNDDPKQIFSMTQRGIDFMDDAVAASQPFYLQLSHYAVHTDIESTPEALAKYSAKPAGADHDDASYAAMTEDLDKSVGLILDYLEDKGIVDNTYIIYTSDNGAQTNFSSNVPLRYGKMFVFEGGVRVPMIVSGPNVVANGHTDFPVIGYDLLPTFFDWIGEDLSVLADIDGESFKAVLEDNSLKPNRKPLIFHSPHYDDNASKTPRSAVVDGASKLVIEYETGRRLGYDLSSDIGEVNDAFDFVNEEDANLLVTLRNYLRMVDAQMPTYSLTNDDTDGDGLPDEWEIRELLGTLFDGSDDPDEDGITNLEEYTNNSDPLINESGSSITLNLSHMKDVLVYPNPSSGEIHIDFSSSSNRTRFSLFDLSGSMLMDVDLEPLSNVISSDELVRATYIYHIHSDGRLISTGRLSFE